MTPIKSFRVKGGGGGGRGVQVLGKEGMDHKTQTRFTFSGGWGRD